MCSYFNVENVFFWFLILCSISADAYIYYICICVRLCEKNEFKRQNQILNLYEFAVLYWNPLRCIQGIDNLGSSCRLHTFIYFINVYRFFFLSPCTQRVDSKLKLFSLELYREHIHIETLSLHTTFRLSCSCFFFLLCLNDDDHMRILCACKLYSYEIYSCFISLIFASVELIFVLVWLNHNFKFA